MMSPIEMLAMTGSGLIMFLVPALATPFLYIYLIHDYSGRRRGDRDPLLGTKVFTTLMMTLGAQLALIGAAFIAIAIVGDGPGDFARKTGMGMILAGVLVAAFPTYLYFARVRTEGGARVAHQALGVNALLAGVAFTALMVAVCQGLFHDGDVAEPLSVAVIYGGVMVATGIRLLNGPLPTAHLRSGDDR